VKQWLFTLLAGMSLVLHFALIVLWVRSYFVSDIVRCEEAGGESPWVIHVLYAGCGRLCFGDDVVGVHSWDVNDGGPTSIRSWSYERDVPEPLRPFEESMLGRLGLFYEEGWAHGERWVAPIWLLALVTAIPSLIRIRAFVGGRLSVATGLCISCGYDLRATLRLRGRQRIHAIKDSRPL
jgi:hypothetical protein